MDVIQHFFNDAIYNTHYDNKTYVFFCEYLLNKELIGYITHREWFNYRNRLLNWREHYRFEPEILIKKINRILYDSEIDIKETIKDVFRSFNKGIINEKEFEILKLNIIYMINVREENKKFIMIRRGFANE